MWKALNIEGYPLKISNQVASHATINTRALTEGRPIKIGSSILPSKTCISDAIRIWNSPPIELKNSNSLHQRLFVILHEIGPFSLGHILWYVLTSLGRISCKACASIHTYTYMSRKGPVVPVVVKGC